MFGFSLSAKYPGTGTNTAAYGMKWMADATVCFGLWYQALTCIGNVEAEDAQLVDANVNRYGKCEKQELVECRN